MKRRNNLGKSILVRRKEKGEEAVVDVSALKESDSLWSVRPTLAWFHELRLRDDAVRA